MAQSMTTQPAELSGQLDGLVAVAGLAHHFDRLVVFEHTAEAASHEAADRRRGGR
jgi:hypothetical protein